MTDIKKALDDSWDEILAEIERRVEHRLYVPSGTETTGEIMEALFSPPSEFSAMGWSDIVRVLFDRQDAETPKIETNGIAYPTQHHYNATVEAVADSLKALYPEQDYIVHKGYIVVTLNPDADEHPFEQLSERDQDDLIAWANIGREDVTLEMLGELADMFDGGDFQAWDCPECGQRCYNGTPDSWRLWQGVNNVDYTSYPGNSERYTEQYLENLCDTCRRTSWN